MGRLVTCKDKFLIVYPTIEMAKIAADPIDRHKNNHDGVTYSGILGDSSRSNCPATDVSLKSVLFATNHWTKFFNERITHSYPFDIMLCIKHERDKKDLFIQVFHPNFVGWIVVEYRFQQWYRHIRLVQSVD